MRSNFEKKPQQTRENKAIKLSRSTRLRFVVPKFADNKKFICTRNSHELACIRKWSLRASQRLYHDELLRNHRSHRQRRDFRSIIINNEMKLRPKISVLRRTIRKKKIPMGNFQNIQPTIGMMFILTRFTSFCF